MNKSGSNRPLRILHIILAVKPPNGQYHEHCLPMRHKREITIVTYFKSIWGITPPPEITLFDGDNSFGGFLRALRAALEAKEHDVIHVHTPHAGALLPLSLLLFGLYGKLKPTTVHTIQNSFQNFKLRHKLMFIPGFAFNQRLVFCSLASYESFPRVYKWLGGSRMCVVQNTVDLDRIDRVAQVERGGTRNDFRLVTVGLIKMKNPLTVLKAFGECSNLASSLVFLGEGNLRPVLVQEIERAGLQSRVRMTGMVERDFVYENFRNSDLFVSASWGEGLPVAVLEAMACRLPVILSDIPPHQEIAEGADFIPLVAPGDVKGFAQEIAKFREMTPAERRLVGQKCRELIEDRFSLAAMHAGYDEVYSQIISQKPLSSLKAAVFKENKGI